MHRTGLRHLPALCHAGLMLVLGGGLFDLACHLADQLWSGNLAVEEYAGHVAVLVGMVVVMAGVWSIPRQRRSNELRKE